MVKKCNTSSIIGLGIDIIEIHRIKKAISRHKNFINRIFTEGEIQYFYKKNMNPQTIAGYFAAKEAVGKAIGCGIYKGKWQEIEIVKNSIGMPLVELHGATKKYADECDCNNLLISISHCKTYAVANAVISR